MLISVAPGQSVFCIDSLLASDRDETERTLGLGLCHPGRFRRAALTRDCPDAPELFG